MLKISILFVIFLLVFPIVQAQYKEPVPQELINFFFRIYRDDSVELIKLERSYGYTTFYNYGDYRVRVVSDEGEILDESPVDIFFLYNKTKKDGVLVNYSVREYVDVYLSLPYFPNAARIQLYHFDKLIYETELSFEEAAQKHCGNDVCEEWEDYKTCPLDCPKPTTTTTIKITAKTGLKSSTYLYLFLIIILLFIIILLMFMIYRAKVRSYG